MSLNSFIWNNYKQTEQGKKAIEAFSSPEPAVLLRAGLNWPQEEIEFDAEMVVDLLEFATLPELPDQIDFEAAESLFRLIATDGITLSPTDSDPLFYNPEYYLHEIHILSTWLYLNYPDIFKPYFFKNNFDILKKIADAFGIDLPEVPLKRQKEKRLFHYIELCGIFSTFQQDNNLTAAELCAFLYDFAPAYLAQSLPETAQLPEPTQVWWIGGDKGGGDFEFLDNAKPQDTSFWQGNEDTRKGDILVMYCLSPRSYIHSVWRATRDGIADPFFHYYSNVYIGHGQKVAPVTIHELKADSHFSQNALVRKNLQGINGYPLTSEDYNRLQELFRQKGFDTSQLPQLYSYVFDLNKNLQTEREVEVALIEPLLEQLGYTNADWVRQLPVRMGRGERNFPDYAFLSDRTPGYEKATMLIESKFWIKSNRELEEAFRQVWSYGQRLGATQLVLADKDAIWIYNKKDAAFDRLSYQKFFWKQLQEPDTFSRLLKAIGKR